jgi:hypothetical protein
MAQIMEDVNTFTASNNELVILNLSQDLNTNTGNLSYSPFTQAQWDALLDMIDPAGGGGLNYLYIAPDPLTVDLTWTTLSTFIGTRTPAVVVIVSPSDPTVTLGDYASRGCYSPASFPLYDSYADKDNVQAMILNQSIKLKAQRPNPDSPCFLFSWTLTQQPDGAAGCILPHSPFRSILDLAELANAQLSGSSGQLLPLCTSATYPNIVHIDNVQTGAPLSTVMAINNLASPSAAAV